MAERVAVPASVREMRLLDRVDYEDAFARDVPVDQSPRESLRSALRGAPRGLLGFVHLAQRGLGLRLRTGSDADPLGWTILRDDADACVIGADGPFGAIRLAVTTPPGRVEVTTQTRLTTRGRVGWPLVAPVHRAVARVLIDRARIPAR